MTFYRVRYLTEGGNSGGVSWHTSKRQALATAKKDWKIRPEEYEDNPHGGIEDRIQVITITPTKAGILDALSRYADHPDNG